MTSPFRPVASSLPTVSGSPSGSLSFANASTTTAVSSSVLAMSSEAWGSSFMGVTRMSTVAVSVPPFPSVTVYVNESGPL